MRCTCGSSFFSLPSPLNDQELTFRSRSLGDKFLEADGRIGPVQFAPEAVAAAPPSPPSTLQPPGLNDALITSYFAAAIDSVASIAKLPSLSTLLLSLPATATDAERVQVLSQAAHSWIGRPTLALMSDDAAAVRAFRLHPLAKHFNIVGTAEVASPPHSPSIESRSEGSAFVDVGDAASTDATTSNGSRQREKEGKNRLDIVKRTPKPFRHDQKLGGVKWHAAPARKVIPPGFVRLFSFFYCPPPSALPSTATNNLFSFSHLSPSVNRTKSPSTPFPSPPASRRREISSATSRSCLVTPTPSS